MKTTLVDTNVVIRLFVKDDLDQLKKSEVFFQKVESDKAKAIFSVLVIQEIIWVLERVYKLKKITFTSKVIALLMLKGVDILEAKKEIIIYSLQHMEKYNVDFTDAYLFVNNNEHDIFSFDSDFKKLRKEKVRS